MYLKLGRVVKYPTKRRDIGVLPVRHQCLLVPHPTDQHPEVYQPRHRAQ